MKCCVQVICYTFFCLRICKLYWTRYCQHIINILMQWKTIIWTNVLKVINMIKSTLFAQSKNINFDWNISMVYKKVLSYIQHFLVLFSVRNGSTPFARPASARSAITATWPLSTVQLSIRYFFKQGSLFRNVFHVKAFRLYFW